MFPLENYPKGGPFGNFFAYSCRMKLTIRPVLHIFLADFLVNMIIPLHKTNIFDYPDTLSKGPFKYYVSHVNIQLIPSVVLQFLNPANSGKNWLGFRFSNSSIRNKMYQTKSFFKTI